MSNEMNPNIQQLFQMSQQLQQRITQLNSELGQKTVSTSAGGGMVTATTDGKGNLRKIKIDPEVVASGDVEMIEELVLAAVASAQERAARVYEEEMKKVSGGLNLPFSIPGL